MKNADFSTALAIKTMLNYLTVWQLKTTTRICYPCRADNPKSDVLKGDMRIPIVHICVLKGCMLFR